MRAGYYQWAILHVAVAMGGCSNYDTRWQNPSTAVNGKDLYEGSYSGKWESQQYRNTSGKLWCILVRDPADKDQYTASFRATWHGIFASEHSVKLRITERTRKNGVPVVKFNGEAEIKMWIGSGKYRCRGELTPARLEADYDAAYDRGTFTLSLVKKPAAGMTIRAAGSFEQGRH